ncbi:MAG TPA: hypothetical protein PL105_04055 [Caldilineaceae bacterium]|nr:hypothetical protein [Caldilineaceae bacterium]
MKITQIIPATGWSAVFESKDGRPLTLPVACFALYDDGSVSGLVGPDVLGPADDDQGFLAYVGPGESPDLYT